MNKNALNKNLQLFFVTLFIGAFIYSCKKDKLNNEDSTTISQVQTWFKEQTSSRPITTSLFTQNSGTRKISSLKSSVGVQGTLTSDIMYLV
jgi:hypothetical protein